MNQIHQINSPNSVFTAMKHMERSIVYYAPATTEWDAIEKELNHTWKEGQKDADEWLWRGFKCDDSWCVVLYRDATADDEDTDDE